MKAAAKCLSICLLGAASHAAAQDIPFDTAIVENCVAKAQDETQMRACIGQVADACVAQNGGSNAGMGSCLGAERDWWDTLLNTSYDKQVAAEQRREADAKEYGYDAPPTVEPLREMQRVWIRFRDAACAYEHATWGGGSGGPVAHAACEMKMTGEQAAALTLRARRAGQQ